MDIKKHKIEKALNECKKHIEIILDADTEIKTIMPISADKYIHLSKLEVQVLDQFLFRFSKLQDSIGQKLFKALFSYIEEDIERKTFIDILNRLEKLEIIESANQWRELRDIRNNLAHNYDENSEEMANTINQIYSKKYILIDIYENIKKYYKDKL